MHRLLVLTMLVGLGACVSEAHEPEIARVEGRTAAVADGASLYALRLWTAPLLDSLHRIGTRADSLSVQPAVLRLRRGDRMPLARLHVVAHDSAGRPVPGAPIVLECRSTLLELTPTAVVARAVGRAKVQVRSLLPGTGGRPDAVAEIQVLVDR